MRITTLLAIIVFIGNSPLFGQTPTGLNQTLKGPNMDIIRQILAEGPPPAAGGTSTSSASVVKFKRSRSGGVSDSLAKAFGKSETEIATLTQAFDDIVRGYNDEVVKQGKADDVAAAMTFFLTTAVIVYNDAPEPPESATEETYKALARSISASPQLAKMSDSDKQQLHDWLVSIAGFALTNYQDSKQRNDAAGLKTIREFADLAARIVLGRGLDGFTTKSVTSPRPSAQSAPATTSSNATGISKATTTFNDGWTAGIEADGVHLVKGGIDVYLLWPIEFTDEIRSHDTADYMWNAVVVPRFTVATAQKFEDRIPDFLERLYYYEGTGKQKSTGRSGFIAMKAISSAGFSNVIVAFASDRSAYKAEFPEPTDLTKMLNANRFAITAGDLAGAWKGMDGTNLLFYNSNTGNYAGASTVAVSDEFTFSNGGTYQSDHAQGSTQFGVTRGGRQQYKGKFTASDWGLTLTGRWEGKTENFDAYFQAVKGGRVLHLTNREATGIQFHLRNTR